MLGHFGWGMMGGIGWLWMILVWVVVILLAVWLVRSLFSPTGTERSDKALTARDILDLRYARGEVDRKQYEQMKRDLEK